MGNYWSEMLQNLYFSVNISRKRKIEEAEDDKSSDDTNTEKHKSKRLKLMSTTEYIYKTLFIEGRDADVTVQALGNQWHLHKIYLCQSPYFNSMFSGNWRESKETSIDLKITDENITIASLHTAFGSLYRDDIEVDVEQSLSLLATSVFLQMESIVDQCANLMKETISIKNVLTYQNAATCYGVAEIEKVCVNWLLVNLLSEVIDHPATLSQIPIGLMYKLVSSPNLYTIQTEYSVYMMLKVWLYLNINQCAKGRFDDLFRVSSIFFKDRGGVAFLKSAQGAKFIKVFTALRVPHLLMIYTDFEAITTDRILPLPWIQMAVTQQWHSMIRINELYDRGPADLDEEVFLKKCCRCGRVLVSAAQTAWRWSGYNFNLDLVLSQHNSILKLKRSFKNELSSNTTQHVIKQLMYRISVSSLNEQKQVIFSQTSGIQSTSLSKNSEVRLLTLEKDVTYPLYLSANFLLSTPESRPLFGIYADGPNLDIYS